MLSKIKPLKYCFFDPGVCSFKRHHQAVRGTSRAGQALQTFRHEKVPTEREQRAEETVSRQKVKMISQKQTDK